MLYNRTREWVLLIGWLRIRPREHETIVYETQDNSRKSFVVSGGHFGEAEGESTAGIGLNTRPTVGGCKPQWWTESGRRSRRRKRNVRVEIYMTGQKGLGRCGIRGP